LTSIERAFRQLSNGTRHFMPSTDRRLELKAKDIDGSDRLTAGCVLIDLASLAVSRTAVYASGLTAHTSVWLGMVCVICAQHIMWKFKATTCIEMLDLTL
jgi:hypothetical protein